LETGFFSISVLQGKILPRQPANQPRCFFAQAELALLGKRLLKSFITILQTGH